MKRLIILKKIQVTMKAFVSPFFNHFSLSLSKKETCGNESHEKETINIFTLQLPILLHIRIGNISWCKYQKSGYCKNEAREIDCLCCREIEMDAMLID